MATNHALQKRDASTPARASAERTRRTVAPAADVIERSDGFVVVADLPGVHEDSVQIHVERNVLTIEAQRAPHDLPDQDLVYAEYEPFDYRRAFVLSDEVDLDRIEATVSAGVLRLTLPKAEKARPRQIAVKAVS